MSQTYKVLVVGASGGTGREAVARLMADGHTVTAFSRHADQLGEAFEGLLTVNGDATDQDAVDHAVAGQDVVVVTLGIAENPIRVRLLGPSRTPADVRSRGTRNVITAMRRNGVDRLIVQSTFGVGETRDLLGFSDRLFFRFILKPQVADTEAQEDAVKQSGLDWVLVQPVHLADGGVAAEPAISTSGQTREMTVDRSSVARFLAGAVRDPQFTHTTVTVSG